MAKQKLKKFAELATLGNVLQMPNGSAGRWRNNGEPLIVELACGQGDYTLELARRYPQATVVGVDIKGARLWRGAKAALAEGLDNVRFLRADIAHLADYFLPREINEIWITFPDPFPKKSQIKKRLTSPRFLNTYAQLLTPGGKLHLKTDDTDLFEYSVATITADDRWQARCISNNIHAQPYANALLSITTRYEKQHIAAGRQIHYAAWILR